jgi:outer membrane protein OmpA-like peptidoglycan-associated protein
VGHRRGVARGTAIAPSPIVSHRYESRWRHEEEAADPIQRRSVAPGKRTVTQSRYPGPTETAAETPAVGGRALPPDFRAEMESILGIDLAAVRVHEGGQATAAGALAFTRGTDIHFAPGQYDPDSERGRDLLGHELAHVAQQARGAVAATMQVGGMPVNDDPGLESEADRIGQVAARGVAPGPRAAALAPAPTGGAIAQRKVEFLSGNPQDNTDGHGSVIATHQSPSLGDAVDGPAAPAPAHGEARNTHVRVVATRSAPHHVEPGGVAPTPSAIYQEAGPSGSTAPAGFTTIAGLDGTVVAPQIEQVATTSLYIDGKPRADDVHQRGLGDCYFLAATASIAAHDPGKIKSIMSPNGSGGALVALWRAEPHVPTFLEQLTGKAPKHDWHQVVVTVTEDLSFNLFGGGVDGAQLRCAPAPRSSDYWAKVSGSDLEVHRVDSFDMARWVPLLEKAYARFAETHGEYGGARKQAAAPDPGYDAIEGGLAHHAMCLFYGPAADDPANQLKTRDTVWSPGADLVAANARVMDMLVALQGHGSESPAGLPDAPIMTASVQVAPLIERLLEAIPAAMADPDWVNLDFARQSAVIEAQAIAGAWKALPDDPNPPAPQPKAAVRALVGDACARAIVAGVDESTGEQQTLADIQSLIPGPIRFARGRDTVSSGDATSLQQLGAMLIDNDHPKVAVQIDGYASQDRTPDPQGLSERRARNVEAELLAGGPVAPHTTAVAGKGEPLASDRKAELTILPAGHSRNDLLDRRRSEPLRAVADLMLNLRNEGTDASSGQRNVYGGHAYSILSASIVGPGEIPVPLALTPPAMRPLLYPLVDPDTSRVRIRNPHHGNEPDRLDSDRPSRGGDGAPDGDQSDGVFTVSLREFFLNFTAVRGGVFPKTSGGE